MLVSITESLHSLNDEEQSKGLQFCLIKLQQQHLAAPSPAADGDLECWEKAELERLT